MSMIKPMLGVNVDLSKLSYPIYASRKLDGVRAIVKDGVVYSRNGKPIPNEYTQKLFGQLHGLDGELIVDKPTNDGVFQDTISGVMTATNWPNVYFHVFDSYLSDGGIIDRYDDVIVKCTTDISEAANERIVIVDQFLINTENELLEFEQECLNLGYEGVIIRKPDAKYKFGRSTIKDGALLKLKRFTDSEAVIQDMLPLYQNQNQATTNALGYTERSTRRENMVALDMLGSILVKDIHTGIEFSIGSGFTEQQRINFWKQKLEGKIVKYKYFTVGIKDKPRFPIFLGFRPENDLGG